MNWLALCLCLVRTYSLGCLCGVKLRRSHKAWRIGGHEARSEISAQALASTKVPTLNMGLVGNARRKYVRRSDTMVIFDLVVQFLHQG